MHLVVYHQTKAGTDCPDGICAAWIVAKYLKERFSVSRPYQLIPDVYLKNSAYESLLDTPISPTFLDTVWLVDFSYPEHIMKEILEKTPTLIILDHHEQRMPDISVLADQILGGYSPNECGATAAWKFCFPEIPRPWFLKHVWRRDTGAEGYYDALQLDSRAVTTAISARRRGLTGESAFPIFESLLKESEKSLITEGYKLLEIDDQICEQVLIEFKASPTFENIGGYEVPCIRLDPHADRLYSWIGSLLCQEYPSSSFVCLITSSEPNQRHLRSLKSGSNFDVGALAKSLGGGGHRNASGFTV
jgi:uncharacterized protein